VARSKTEVPDLSLRRHRNPARHVRMKAAEIIHFAGVVQRDATGPLRGDGVSQSLLRAVAVCATKSPLTHSIVSPTWAETCAGENLSSSMVTRIVSAARAGAAHAITPNKLVEGRAVEVLQLGFVGGCLFGERLAGLVVLRRDMEFFHQGQSLIIDRLVVAHHGAARKSAVSKPSVNWS
jgi:hypothetical protein